ncbi:MAG: methyl-accepting chemotaxis protein [Marichromatium sp.]|nr:methyl-accepting chemotaxis protein [Marichromatium sp.]
MFKYLPLWANILLGMGLAIALAVAALTYNNLHDIDRLTAQAEREQLALYADSLQADIAAETRLAAAMSTLVANLPDIQSHFAAGDRAWLRAALEPAYRKLHADYGVVQFQFHTPPATSMLRLHMPERHGDDLSGFRHSVVDTNREREPQHGLEVGVANLGARGIVPVAWQGRHVGSVEFGMAFGADFFATFKQHHGVDAALHLARADGLRTFAGTFGAQPLLDDSRLRAALAGTPQLVHARLGTTPVAVYASAVTDYSGTPIGVIELVRDRSAALAAIAASTREAWLVAALVAGLSLVLTLLTARALERRIRRLAGGIKQIAAGDLSHEIAIDGRDELAALGHDGERMRRHLHGLVGEVEQDARAVDEAAREIAGAVEGQAATSSEMSASIAEITSTMEELSASSTQIAEYSGSVAEIAKRTYDDSLQGAESMQQLAAQMEEIRRDNQHALAEIVALGHKSKEISKVMEIIDTVADQTKLIAFNAALEASSAGEAGKRFGVVAAEIRRLADSVTDSTSEISNKVIEIQDAINRLVINSEKGSQGIAEGLEASSRSSEILRSLVEAAGETTSSAQQISLSTQQQKTASNQVVVALREIVTASADTAQSVQRIAQVAQQMTQLSTNLGQRVDRFELGAAPAADTRDPA